MKTEPALLQGAGSRGEIKSIPPEWPCATTAKKTQSGPHESREAKKKKLGRKKSQKMHSPTRS